MAAQDAHDKKLQKSLALCDKEGLHFVPLAWESLGGATETVHDTLGRWTELEGARGASTALIRAAGVVLLGPALGSGSDRSPA